MRKKKPNILLENIEITDIASEGNAVAKVNLTPGPSPHGEGGNITPGPSPATPHGEVVKKTGIIVFVKGAVPGDVADLEIFRKKKNYAEAKVVRIHKFSAKRVEPFCNHFGTCGGCKWQNLQYQEQLFYKQKQVADALVHIGKLNLTASPSPAGEGSLILQIIPSKNQTHYRNKLEFAFSNKRWLTTEEIKTLDFGGDRGALGFHVSGMFDKVLDIEHCYLQPPPSNEIRLAIKEYALRNNLTFFDFRKQVGFLRNIIIRNSTLGETMVVVVFGPSPALPQGKGDANTQAEKNKSAEESKFELLDFISGKFPEITSLMYINNPKKNDTIYDLDVHLFKGRDFIFEMLEDLKFKISAKSFFQTNSHQALELYKVARDFAGIKKEDVVYDLYTGTGTIANFVARSAKKVVGIESIPDAIEDARENSALNNIGNTNFFAGDMRNSLNEEFFAAHGKPDVVITDPPRAGMDEKVVKKILEIAPRRIVYVSCNPATQARDMAILSENYDLKKIQPVDMFPHTHHVENVAVMERRDEKVQR